MPEEVVQVIVWDGQARSKVHRSVSLNATVGDVADLLARQMALPEKDFWGQKRLIYTLQFRQVPEPLAREVSLGRVGVRRGSQLQLVGFPDDSSAPVLAAQPSSMGQPNVGQLTCETAGGALFPFSKAVNIIGRKGGKLPADIDLEAVDINDSGYRVSRNHAELRYNEGKWTLRLLEARNETFVDDVQLHPSQPVAVNDGSAIRISRDNPIILRVKLG